MMPERLNSLLRQRAVPGRFCAAQYTVYDSAAATLRYSNAGTPPVNSGSQPRAPAHLPRALEPVGMYDTFTRMDKLPSRDVLDFYGSQRALAVNGSQGALSVRGSPRTFFANGQFHNFSLASWGR